MIQNPFAVSYFWGADAVGCVDKMVTPLTVTGQPTSEVGVFYLVTVDAKSHFKIDPFDPVHGFHAAVTFLAFDLAVYVALVIKQDMLGQVIDFPPRRGGFCIKISMFFLNPGVIGDDIIMAMETFFNRWQPGVIGTIHVRVAVPALGVFNPCMHPVAERNGLFRTDACCRRHVKIIEEKDHR